MKNKEVIELFRPFDPVSPEAESQYDSVVRRLNLARARRSLNDRERRELERQFIENDLNVASGARRGLALSPSGRRKRLQRLVELSIDGSRFKEEENFANRDLDRMNEALDRWARETYGS